MITDGRAALIGPVRQELLSGIKSLVQFDTVRDVLAGFSDLVLERSDYESAAQYYNICRGHGIQGSNTDFLICAVAVARDMPILSVDQDFTLFQKYLQLKYEILLFRK